MPIWEILSHADDQFGNITRMLVARILSRNVSNQFYCVLVVIVRGVGSLEVSVDVLQFHISMCAKYLYIVSCTDEIHALLM